MTYQRDYALGEPTRANVDALPGVSVIEFGAPWCGHCMAAQPALHEVLRGRGDLRHLKIEDGSGRPLGRSFRVKLWPTLIIMRDGHELARLVRPRTVEEIRDALSVVENANRELVD
jgi:thioredoxin 1